MGIFRTKKRLQIQQLEGVSTFLRAVGYNFRTGLRKTSIILHIFTMNIFLIINSKGKKNICSGDGYWVRTKNTPGMGLSIRKPVAGKPLKMPFEGLRNDSSWLTYNGCESVIIMSEIPAILV